VPILTDPVAELERVFGDTIATASDVEGFTAQVADCMADPTPWLARAARAREIVLAGHSFDHRARALADRIERIAGARP
jgi:spore maturation protein CgeB